MYSLDGEHLKHSLQLGTLRFIVAILDFYSTVNVALKRKFKVLNKRIIIPPDLHLRQVPILQAISQKGTKSEPEQRWTYNRSSYISALVFECVCVRHNSENNTFSNMPGCIESARQTSSCCPCNSPSSLGGQVAHCATPPHHGKTSWGPGWTYEPVGDAIMCICTRLERRYNALVATVHL